MGPGGTEGPWVIQMSQSDKIGDKSGISWLSRPLIWKLGWGDWEAPALCSMSDCCRTGVPRALTGHF